MGPTHRHFVPAAGHDWLLPLYDPMWKLVGGDKLRRELVEHTGVKPGQRVLDIGCGTGSLVVLAAQELAAVSFAGLDPDPKALARARTKAWKAGVQVEFKQGYAEELPFANASFDQVWSSMMFHHLDAEVKRKTLAEVRRVLAPGGFLHLLDFSGGEAPGAGLLARLLHSHNTQQGKEPAGISALMDEAGLRDATRIDTRRLLFGSVSHHRATAPSD